MHCSGLDRPLLLRVALACKLNTLSPSQILLMFWVLPEGCHSPLLYWSRGLLTQGVLPPSSWFPLITYHSLDFRLPLSVAMQLTNAHEFLAESACCANEAPHRQVVHGHHVHSIQCCIERHGLQQLLEFVFIQ